MHQKVKAKGLIYVICSLNINQKNIILIICKKENTLYG